MLVSANLLIRLKSNVMYIYIAIYLEYNIFNSNVLFIFVLLLLLFKTINNI